jgi:hypothetical protein
MPYRQVRLGACRLDEQIGDLGVGERERHDVDADVVGTRQTDGVPDHRQDPIAQTGPADYAGEQSLHVITPKPQAL